MMESTKDKTANLGLRLLGPLGLVRPRLPSKLRGLRRLASQEDGSTTVAAALLIASFVTLTLVGAAAGVNVVKGRQAAVAADLTAVAGAVAAQAGDAACAAAERIARANQAMVATCEILGEDVQVKVERRGKTAVARAGPVEAS